MWFTTLRSRLLGAAFHFCREEGLQRRQGAAAVGDRVLDGLVHLRVRHVKAVGLEDGVPAKVLQHADGALD